jgi:hypothetical protein
MLRLPSRVSQAIRQCVAEILVGFQRQLARVCPWHREPNGLRRKRANVIRDLETIIDLIVDWSYSIPYFSPRNSPRPRATTRAIPCQRQPGFVSNVLPAMFA